MQNTGDGAGLAAAVDSIARELGSVDAALALVGTSAKLIVAHTGEPTEPAGGC